MYKYEQKVKRAWQQLGLGPQYGTNSRQ